MMTPQLKMTGWLALAVRAMMLVAPVAIAGCGSDKSEEPVADPLPQEVKQYYGVATDSDADYQQLSNYFKQLSPRAAGAWGTIEVNHDYASWLGVDRAYTYARKNNLYFTYRSLIWGKQQPNWLSAYSPEQQLIEVDQWMGMVAKRYPDVEMVTVVNEPFSNPPPYKDILGGDGTTGYDWVIKSFEMARAHFPHAKLLINEGSVLQLPEWAQKYRNLIKLLRDRNLVDIVGVQGHDLEHVDLEYVGQSLDILASLGLPIHITEFEVNFEDNAKQEYWTQQLFGVFKDHPVVNGITQWGYLQGGVGKRSAYLIGGNGTHRPAFDWILCEVSGEASCPLIDYTPPGWHGTETGLTVQAEHADELHHVLAVGRAVTYTDDGDWIKFTGVEFNPDWNPEVSILYTKTNDLGGTVTFHLDSLNSPAVATITPTQTADGQTFVRLGTAWPATSGTHDVYVRFNGATGGIADVDTISFGVPDESASVPGPRSHITFDEEETGDVALDSGDVGLWSGNFVNGVTRVPGLFKEAIQLDGEDDYVTMPTGITADLDAITVSIWVKLDEYRNWSRAWDFGSDNNNYMFLSPARGWDNDHHPQFGIRTRATGEQSIVGPEATPVGVWTHFAVTLNGPVGVLYVNGEAVGTNPQMTLKPSDLGYPASNFFGKSQYPDPLFKGQVDEFRIYDYAMTPEEIRTLATPPTE
eukprot:TRINITY_DN4682_c0_g1_i3.p1 TRINITY_DN4682_c0_g1~~TRINITY_DN4682_c0_g1_i3.p1  ORF type:complete len:695 (-),score=141.48 TRINITY_DN4682_c0_g1_i3:738-2822(-)